MNPQDSMKRNQKKWSVCIKETELCASQRTVCSKKHFWNQPIIFYTQPSKQVLLPTESPILYCHENAGTNLSGPDWGQELGSWASPPAAHLLCTLPLLHSTPSHLPQAPKLAELEQHMGRFPANLCRAHGSVQLPVLTQRLLHHRYVVRYVNCSASDIISPGVSQDCALSHISTLKSTLIPFYTVLSYHNPQW